MQTPTQKELQHEFAFLTEAPRGPSLDRAFTELGPQVEEADGPQAGSKTQVLILSKLRAALSKERSRLNAGC